MKSTTFRSEIPIPIDGRHNNYQQKYVDNQSGTKPQASTLNSNNKHQQKSITNSSSNQMHVEVSSAIHISDISESSKSSSSYYKNKISSTKQRKKDSVKSSQSSSDSTFSKGTKKQTVNGAATRELNIIKLSDTYCEIRKNDAKDSMSEYINPVTNGIQDSMIKRFVKNVVNADHIFAFEFMLAILECLIYSETKTKEKLFELKEDSGVRTIFKRWLYKAILTLKNQIYLEKCRDQPRMEISKVPSYMVTVKIIELFLSFQFLTTEYLQHCKDTLDLNFRETIDQVNTKTLLFFFQYSISQIFITKFQNIYYIGL